MAAITESRKEQIVETALRHLYRYGYNRFSFGQLSAECGVPKSSILHHFPTKDALVLAAVDRYVEEERARLKALSEDESLDPRGRFFAYFDKARQGMSRSDYLGCLAANLGLETAETNPPLRSAIGRFIEEKVATFASWVEQGMATGQFRPDAEPVRTAQSVLTSLEGGIATSKISKSEKLLEIALEVCRNIIRGIEAR